MPPPRHRFGAVNWDTVTPYDRGFREYAEAYEAFGFEDIHREALPFLPSKAGLVLDVGAGSGRDADWFARRGWEVVAAEPAAALRAEAARLHQHGNIKWIDDRLPSLAYVHRNGLGFDLVWLSAVWMHIPPEDRPRAMRKLATLLKPGGRLVMTLRHGPVPEDRPMWAVEAHEVERLGLDHGLALRVATERVEDRGGREDVRWQTVVLDLPDDGAGALPLLRGVILRQEKSTTYKLALLRCIARIADASPNIARDVGDAVELPLGLIALYWIRMYKPLVERDLPQSPTSGLSFVTPAFKALRQVAPYDLRPGTTFAADRAKPLRRALADAAQLIARMPALHLTFADNVPVFPTECGQMPRSEGTLAIDHELLWAFGSTRVPLNVWQAMRRMAAWIEPMLVAEWVRMVQGYADRASRPVAAGGVLAALRWLDPERDTQRVRALALSRLRDGKPVSCVWSNRPLRADALDIDHCLPWSAWPCGDLWNLLPAAPRINRAGKRERIVASNVLQEARPRITDWWNSAYLGDSALRLRFTEEVSTSLPIAPERALALEDVFAALDFRRLRLRQETEVPEWAGISSRLHRPASERQHSGCSALS